MTIPRISTMVTFRQRRCELVLSFVTTYRQEVAEALEPLLLDDTSDMNGADTDDTEVLLPGTLTAVLGRLLHEAIAAGADICMLDNMSVEAMTEAVRVAGGECLLEASGGVTIESVRSIAETGVDLVSVGALTHSSPAADLAFEIEPRLSSGE